MAPTAADFPARVGVVTAGDTITVPREGHDRAKVRPTGIDAPVTGQDDGSRAKQAASVLDATRRPLRRASLIKELANRVPGTHLGKLERFR